jgi:predicted enzyme related to lactoylglutathione lyase
MSSRVVHFEIPYDDANRARRFYADAFGWQVTPLPEMSYTMVATGPTPEQGPPTEPGFINGGMTERTGPVTTPVITIAVDNIDAALDRIEKLGGTRFGDKMPVGEMGFAAYFRDTEGNVTGLWQNA